MSLLAEYYPWIKALHVISVIAWMAGMLYLPRLYVYHTAATPGSELDTTFQTMELRLYRYIMGPAMITTLLFGILLIVATHGAFFQQGWLHAKLALVVILLGLHHALGINRRAFAEGRNKRSARYFRIINEVPTLAMVLIVILVVVKPF